jgi:hypothetical protein
LGRVGFNDGGSANLLRYPVHYHTHLSMDNGVSLIHVCVCMLYACTFPIQILVKDVLSG